MQKKIFAMKNSMTLLILFGRRFDNSNNISILLKLYERYAMLGGKYVSIGSDAHKPENIGFAFKEAYALLDRLNLQPVYFVNRQMQLSKI